MYFHVFGPARDFFISSGNGCFIWFFFGIACKVEGEEKFLADWLRFFTPVSFFYLDLPNKITENVGVPVWKKPLEAKTSKGLKGVKN